MCQTPRAHLPPLPPATPAGARILGALALAAGAGTPDARPDPGGTSNPATLFSATVATARTLCAATRRQAAADVAPNAAALDAYTRLAAAAAGGDASGVAVEYGNLEATLVARFLQYSAQQVRTCARSCGGERGYEGLRLGFAGIAARAARLPSGAPRSGGRLVSSVRGTAHSSFSLPQAALASAQMTSRTRATPCLKPCLREAQMVRRGAGAAGRALPPQPQRLRRPPEPPSAARGPASSDRLTPPTHPPPPTSARTCISGRGQGVLARR